MKDQSSVTLRLQQRRRFISSAVVGGAASLLAPTVLARATDVSAAETCGEITAADPLYLYQTLVPRLQTSAITAIHEQENQQAGNLSDQINQLYNLSTQLKSKLPQQSRLQSAAERLESLAYVGRANSLAVRASAKVRSRDVARAHSQSQRVVTAEIARAATDLASQPGITISDEAWALLQQVIKKIDEIKNVYQPAADQARVTFDQELKRINERILTIQAALVKASSSVVRGDKAEAVRQVDYALAELALLPAPPTRPAVPNAPVSGPENGNAEQEQLTRDKFIELVTPIKTLIGGVPTLPRVSRQGNENFSISPVAFVSPSTIELPNVLLDSSSVREIVGTYIPSGTWWQVVGVTAVCLPLWIAYTRSEHRKELIYNALKAVPREHSKLLWQAAYYLNRLTG